jgi:glycyl-tRNA synthetase beta chain
VRWICAKLDGETLAGGESLGHRFVSGRIEIPSAAGYEDTLREALVEPDAGVRRATILDGLPEGWKDPLGKLEEVVYLAEWPTVLEGTFEERFLRLPRAVVETAMQSHQRYFPLDGSRFAFVANGGDPDIVRAGNENVLNSRLEDAEFSFERDVAVGLDGLAQRLDRITFFAGAGTYADKTARVVELVGRLGGGGNELQAAQYAKADQASELVKEFPELEGHIGAEYARLARVPDEVCTAIDEHFLPDAAGGPLPSGFAGQVVSAADKIDTLNVSFGLGHRPTGSRDPYGLRRAAIGLCRLAREGGLLIPLELLEADVADFVEERLEGLLDVPVEFVRAARTADVSDLGSVARVAEELAAAAGSTEFADAYEAYDRASRLGGRAEADAAAALDPALLEDGAEREVAATLERAKVDPSDVRGSLTAAASLAPVLERYFDEVLVMAEDPAVRGNRLRLLLDVRDRIGRLGDLSLIPR